MWVIRPEQVAALDKAALDEFEQLVAADLRDHYPDDFGPRTDRELRPFIRSAVRRAADHGLRTEFAVLQFAHVLALLGDDFDRRPECGDVTDALAADGHPNQRAETARAVAAVVRRLLDRAAQP